MKGIQAKFKLKGDKLKEPDMYLDTYLSNMTNIDGQECWAMSYEKYCTSSVTNVEFVLEKRGLMLLMKYVNQ